MGLRLSEEFLAQLDEVRGLVPREVWIRSALEWVVRNDMGAIAPNRSPEPPQSRAESFSRATQR